MTTRTIPTEVIPSDPSDTGFEANFRNNTEKLRQATSEIDTELVDSTISGNTGQTFPTLKSRLDDLETKAESGSVATFWETITGASWVVGDSYFEVYDDQRSLYTTNLAIKLVNLDDSSNVYGYVESTDYNNLRPNYTRVFVIADNINTPLVNQFVNFRVEYSAQQTSNLPLINESQLDPNVIENIGDSNIAVTLALT